ncbi:hypothetical protein ACOMHN_051832 [Nucella lapillus]
MPEYDGHRRQECHTGHEERYGNHYSSHTSHKRRNQHENDIPKHDERSAYFRDSDMPQRSSYTTNGFHVRDTARDSPYRVAPGHRLYSAVVGTNRRPASPQKTVNNPEHPKDPQPQHHRERYPLTEDMDPPPRLQPGDDWDVHAPYDAQTASIEEQEIPEWQTPQETTEGDAQQTDLNTRGPDNRMDTTALNANHVKRPGAEECS